VDIAPGNSVRIPNNEIVFCRDGECFHDASRIGQVTDGAEMADLMAFLVGQDQDPETDRENSQTLKKEVKGMNASCRHDL